LITLKIENTRSFKLTKNEEVRKGDNNISAFSIVFPSNFGAGHPRAECAVEMRCYLPNGEFLSYELDTSQPTATQPITYDLTEQEQQVSIMFIITHGVEVIGKTNTETLYVYDAPDSDREPLTPREDCDRVINEQRQTIARQAATIDEQSETIGSQGEQITELSGEVTELSTENARLQALTGTQNDTIQYMIDNPPEPKLYTPPEPIIPESETRVYTPPQNYDGFASFTVDRVTAEGVGFNPDYYKEGETCLGKVGTYNPFPEHSYGGIYYTELGEGGYPKKILVKDMLRSASTIPQFFNASNDAKRELREVVFENCPEFLRIAQGMFQSFNYLIKVILPDSLTSINVNAFSGCTSLTEINLPNSLTSIDINAFAGCTSLTEINLPNSLTSINSNAFYNCTNLTEINLPASLTSIGGGVFYNCTSLTNFTIAQGFNCNNLSVSSSTRFSVETLVAMLEALADRTGQTAYTLTIGATNLNKLTNEQKAIAIGKNWNLA
jgi:hypothetical protein